MGLLILLENGHFSFFPGNQPGRVSKESLWTHRPKLKNVLKTFHVFWCWCYWLNRLMCYAGGNLGWVLGRRLASPLSADCSSTGASQQASGQFRDPLSLGTKILAVGKGLRLTDVLQEGRTCEVSAGATRPCSWDRHSGC